MELSLKVLITGSSGYIGSHIVTQVLEAGHEVIAADRTCKDAAGNMSKLTVTDYPIFSGDSGIYESLGSPDVCIHLAWQNGFQHNDDAHMENLSKHYVFIRDMIRGGLRQIVGMGTMHEVGYWEGMISDDTPTRPRSLYGVAKNAAREFTELLAYQNDAIFQWVRVYYITGDDGKSKSVFQKILVASQEGKTEFPFTSGKNKYDFIDVRELAHQICSVALQKEVTGVINCCSGRTTTLGERAEQFIMDNSLKITLKYGAFPDREYDSPEIWGDDKKIREILSKVEPFKD